MAVSLELLRLGLTYICLLLLWCGATHGGKPEIHALEQVLWSYSYYGQTHAQAMAGELVMAVPARQRCMWDGASPSPGPNPDPDPDPDH